MNELRNRLRDADRIPVPDLWADISSREPKRSRGPTTSPLAVVVLGLVLAALGTFAVARVFLRSSPEPSRPASSPTPFVQVPKANGRIAFVRIDPDSVLARDGAIPKGGLYSVKPNGNGLVSLVKRLPACSSPAWSPDGARLAFRGQVRGRLGIHVMDADSHRIHMLVPCLCEDGVLDGPPAWSPDGSKLAFLRYRDQRDGLWLINQDGSGPRLLRDGLTFGQPMWSPDGLTIALSGSSVDEPESDAIFVLDSQTGRLVRSIRPEGLDVGYGVTWSPGGDWLVFDSVNERAGLYRVRPDGTDLSLVTSGNCPSNTCRVQDPVWSPDGTEVLFTRGGLELGSDGSNGDLFAVAVSTGEIRRVTTGPGLDCCASWQPLAPD